MPKWIQVRNKQTWDYEFVILVLGSSNSSKIIYDRVVFSLELISSKKKTS